jgi:hypothetical protein
MDAQDSDSANSDGYIYEMNNDSDSSWVDSIGSADSDDSYDMLAEFGEHLSKMSSETAGLVNETVEDNLNMIADKEEPSGWNFNLDIEGDQNTSDSHKFTPEENSDIELADPITEDAPALYQTRYLEYPEKFKHLADMQLKDIIGENALRFLPAKSALRCRSVSREWCHKISRPIFPFHQSSSFRSTSGYFSKEYPSFTPLNSVSYGVQSPVLDFLPEAVRILSSSNGLLLCQAKIGETLPYYVCNPATGQFHILPAPAFYHGEASKAVIAYEPSNDLHFRSPYIIICPFTPFEADVTYFEIYFSVTKTWRLWDSYEVFLASDIKNDGFYANGFFFWELTPFSVLVFDTRFELCSVESLPGDSNCTLCYIEGDLCYVSASVTSGVCSVFVRKAVDMSLKFPVVSVAVPYQFFGAFGLCKVLQPSANDDVFCCVLGSGAFSFSLIDKKTSVVAGIQSDRKYVPYVNSLAALDNGNW